MSSSFHDASKSRSKKERTNDVRRPRSLSVSSRRHFLLEVVSIDVPMRNSKLGRVDVDDETSRLGLPARIRRVLRPADLFASVLEIAGVEASIGTMGNVQDLLNTGEEFVDASFVAVEVDLKEEEEARKSGVRLHASGGSLGVIQC